ncbi:MAG: hypothetical protein WCJ30_08300 [Deltaproteobacteria bacterium]
MYPTSIIGLLFIVATLLYLARPSHRSLSFAIRLGVVDLLAGVLGTVTGLISTARYATDRPEPVRVAIVGTGESLNNLALAFVILTLGALIVSFGTLREKADASSSGAGKAA